MSVFFHLRFSNTAKGRGGGGRGEWAAKGLMIFSASLRCPSDVHRLVSSIGRVPDCRAGGQGFEPQTGPTLRVLK